MDRLIRDVLSYQKAEGLDFRSQLAERILLQVGSRIQAFIHANCPPNHVDEAVSRAFHAILTKVNQFTGEVPEAFVAWCFKVTRNAMIDVLRREQKRESWQLTVELDELARAVESTASDEAITSGERMDLELVLNLLRATKPPCDKLLVNYYVLGFEYVEIAEKFEMTADAARMRVPRCLTAAKELAEGLS